MCVSCVVHTCTYRPKRDLFLCLPCLVIGVLWSWVSRRYQHFSVLPISMLAVPTVFFVLLWLSGQSMQVCLLAGVNGMQLFFEIISGEAPPFLESPNE